MGNVLHSESFFKGHEDPQHVLKSITDETIFIGNVLLKLIIIMFRFK